VCLGYFGAQCRRMLAIIVKYVAPQPIALKDVVAEPFAPKTHILASCNLWHPMVAPRPPFGSSRRLALTSQVPPPDSAMETRDNSPG
jgi:hypothetical protein